VFEAAAYGVALTVAPVAEPFEHPVQPVPPGVTRRRSRLTDVLDPFGFDDAGLVRELSAVAMGEAKLAAYQAGLVAAMAARRPASVDRGPDEPGHRVAGWTAESPPVGVSEFFADELAMITGISPAAAVGLLGRSLVLVHELTATWAALADGLVDVARANAIVRALGGQSTAAGGPVDPAVVGEVEAQAVAWAVAGRPRAGCRTGWRRR
jgi:hypothetical protein